MTKKYLYIIIINYNIKPRKLTPRKETGMKKTGLLFILYVFALFIDHQNVQADLCNGYSPDTYGFVHMAINRCHNLLKEDKKILDDYNRFKPTEKVSREDPQVLVEYYESKINLQLNIMSLNGSITKVLSLIDDLKRIGSVRYLPGEVAYRERISKFLKIIEYEQKQLQKFVQPAKE